ncbi:SAV_2336 N-terminal domain-related protein [Microbispora hainanensis]|uniref:SAV_2336 N-terminal domain-related protein n=1 Tax=Microbispora hainanensis TaxID=568844 RepID=UPI00340D1630
MTIDRLSDVLSRTGLDMSAQELSDVLWLAAHLSPESGSVDVSGRTAAHPSLEAPADPHSATSWTAETAPETATTEFALGLELPADDPSGDVHRIQVPDAPMVRHSLPIQRALRPLKRTVPSRVRNVMNEAATAAEIARTGRWIPVMRGAPERWLDLALVVDTGPTMRPWHPMVGELRAVLGQVGAFRDIHVSYLVGDRIALGPDASPGSPAALVDPTGRRVVLVLTDCSGRHWWEGTAQPVVQMWARRNATAVLQPLPERLWRRTAVPVIPGLAAQGKPCGPNTTLHFRPFEETPPASGIPLPVVELDPAWIGDWARLVAGGDTVATAMTYVSARPRSLAQRVDEERSIDLEDRVLRFRATASPEAVRLAGYVAVSTPALPVMRHLQRALLPRSRPQHLAEVLLSGLFRHVSGDHYEFIDERARMAALQLLPRSEAWHAADVLNRLSTGIQASVATAAATFGAVLGEEPDAVTSSRSDRGRPFAFLNAEVLRSLSDLDIPPRRAETRFTGAPASTSPRTTPAITHLPSSVQATPASASHSICMWGTPGSGKTTFLAALSIALMRRKDNWKIVGSDPTSNDYLVEMKRALLHERVFPEASSVLEQYHWMLIGPGAEQSRWWSRKPKIGPERRIRVSMIDAPGGLFAAEEPADGGLTDSRQRELLDNLAQSRGILFLFDPVREFEIGDAFDHLHASLTRLAERMLAAGEVRDGKLPHHIAVCITKFDDRRVFDTAVDRHLVSVEPDDPYGFPRVSDEDARTLFHALCQISRSGTADLVFAALERFFHLERIQFFVTSSIGFFVDRSTNVFDWDDSQNLLADGDHLSLRIRGEAHPINVAEPVLWLGQALTTTGK